MASDSALQRDCDSTSLAHDGIKPRDAVDQTSTSEHLLFDFPTSVDDERVAAVDWNTPLPMPIDEIEGSMSTHATARAEGYQG